MLRAIVSDEIPRVHRRRTQVGRDRISLLQRPRADHVAWLGPPADHGPAARWSYGLQAHWPAGC